MFALIFALFLSPLQASELAVVAGCEELLDTRGQIRWAFVDTKKLFQALQDEKIPLNRPGFQKNEAKVRAVTLRVLLKSISGPAMMGAVQNHHGEWNKKVLADGFNPFEGLKQYKGKFSDDQLLKAIKDLDDAGKSVNVGDMREDHSPESLAIVSKSLDGVPLTLSRLHQIALAQMGGSWPAILKRAKVTILDKVKQADSLTAMSDEKFVAMVRWLSYELPDISRSKFLEQTERVRELTAEKYDNPLAASTIVTSGHSRFGGWLPTLEVSRARNLRKYQWQERLEWSEGRVLEVLRLVAPNFTDVSRKTLRENSDRFEMICFNHFFRLVTVEDLIEQAEFFFGTYLSAVSAAHPWNTGFTFDVENQ